MKLVIIETLEDDVEEQINDAKARGFICFIHQNVDPDHTLIKDKFLHFESEEELFEKINLVNSDITIQDVLRW